jgi:hypothetical protein
MVKYKSHKKIFYFKEYEDARSYAKKHGFPMNRINYFERGWAIQLRPYGSYVGKLRKVV